MAKNFKSNKAYKSWLAYGHASGEFAKTPGNQKVSIKGKPKKVKHEHGGPHDPDKEYLKNWNKARLKTGRFNDQLGSGRIEGFNQNIDEVERVSRAEMSKLIGENPDSRGMYYRDPKKGMHTYFSEPTFLQEFTSYFGGMPQTNLHELTHAMTKASSHIPGEESTGQIKAIQNIPLGTGEYYGSKYSKMSPEGKYNVGPYGYDGDAEEILAQLMEYRKNFNVDPNKIFTEDDIEEVIKNIKKQGARGLFGLEVYEPKELIRLMNEVAMVDDKKSDINMARNGGPKYPSAPYYPYKGSTLRVNKSYDKNHVQPSVFLNGGELVTIGDKTYNTSSKEYRKLVESGKVKPYTTDTKSGIGAFDYGNLPDFEVTAPTQEAVDMAKSAFNRSKQGQAKQQDTQNFLSNNRYRYPESGATKGILESMVEGVIDDPNNLSYYPGAGELYDAGHLGHSLRQGNYEDAAYDAAGFAIPFVGGAAIKKFVKPYLKNAYKYNPFATNLESKIAKENLLARQIYGDEAYENFLKHGPATEYSKNVPRHKQIREWLDADVEDVAIIRKEGKSKDKLKVASSITKDRNFKYPYFQKGNLFFRPNERALYNADMGKGRVIIPKDVNAKSFYPAGETSVIRNVDTAPKDIVKMYSGEKYILSPFDKNSFNSKAFDVYEETPHWLMGNRKIQRHGGAVNSYDKGGHIHPHPENPPVKKQRTWEEEQALGDAYMLSKEQNAASLKALQEEQIRVENVRKNAYNIASDLSKSKNPEDSLVGIKPTNAGNFCNAYSNSVYCQAGATTVEDINFSNYWGKGKDRFIPAGSKHPQIAGNLAEQGKLDEEGFIPISLDKIKKGDRLKKEMYVKKVPWQKGSGSTNPSWKPGHAAIYGGVDERGNPIALDSNGSPLNFSERGWHYPWDSIGDTSTYDPESDSGVDIRTKAYRYVGNTPRLQKAVTNTPVLEKPTLTAKAPTKPIQKLENLNSIPNIKLTPEQTAAQYFSSNTIPSFKYGGCVGKKYKNGGSCGCSKCGSNKLLKNSNTINMANSKRKYNRGGLIAPVPQFPHGGEFHAETPLTTEQIKAKEAAYLQFSKANPGVSFEDWANSVSANSSQALSSWDPRTSNQGYQGIMSNDIVPLNLNAPSAGPIGNTNILDTPPNANLKNRGGFETRNVAPTFNMGGYMKYANGAELETDPPFTKEQFQTAMGSADMSLGVKPLRRSEQYQFYTGKPYKGDRTSFDKGMTALATTGIGAGIGAGTTALNYQNKYMPGYQQQYDSYIADRNAMGSSWADPNKQFSFDEYLDFYHSGQGDFKKQKRQDIGIGALMGSVPGLLASFAVNKGLDKVRMNKNRKHKEALENAKNLGEATDEEILNYRNQQKHGGYMQYANGGQFDTGGQMGEFSSVPVTEFNNGGSHEANPLGGIPQGSNALVEEGELKLDLPNGEQFIVSPKIMYKKNDKEVEAIAQELGIDKREFKRFAGKDMVSVFKSLTRKNSFNAEKREGDTIQENSIEADIMPFVELHTFLTERKNAQEEAEKEQAFAQDMDMMMQEHPEYMQAMMAQQQQQQGPSPEEQAMMEQQMMQQQGGAPQEMSPMMGTYGGMLEYKNGGLWANIHAKRARIKAGSGEKMRKAGSKGAPTAQALKNSQNAMGGYLYKNGGYNNTGFKALPNYVQAKIKGNSMDFGGELEEKSQAQNSWDATRQGAASINPIIGAFHQVGEAGKNMGKDLQENNNKNSIGGIAGDAIVQNTDPMGNNIRILEDENMSSGDKAAAIASQTLLGGFGGDDFFGLATYGGKINPNGSVVHFNNGGYSYSDYMNPQQGMPVQGVAASGYGHGGMMPRQYNAGGTMRQIGEGAYGLLQGAVGSVTGGALDPLFEAGRAGLQDATMKNMTEEQKEELKRKGEVSSSIGNIGGSMLINPAGGLNQVDEVGDILTNSGPSDDPNNSTRKGLDNAAKIVGAAGQVAGMVAGNQSKKVDSNLGAMDAFAAANDAPIGTTTGYSGGVFTGANDMSNYSSYAPGFTAGADGMATAVPTGNAYGGYMKYMNGGVMNTPVNYNYGGKRQYNTGGPLNPNTAGDPAQIAEFERLMQTGNYTVQQAAQLAAEFVPTNPPVDLAATGVNKDNFFQKLKFRDVSGKTVAKDSFIALEALSNYGFNPKDDTVLTSLTRTEELNKKVGGVSNSLHLTGKAMDVSSQGDSKEFLDWTKSEKGKKWMKDFNITKLDETGKTGAPHWHFEFNDVKDTSKIKNYDKYATTFEDNKDATTGMINLDTYSSNPKVTKKLQERYDAMGRPMTSTDNPGVDYAMQYGASATPEELEEYKKKYGYNTASTPAASSKDPVLYPNDPEHFMNSYENYKKFAKDQGLDNPSYNDFKKERTLHMNQYMTPAQRQAILDPTMPADIDTDQLEEDELNAQTEAEMFADAPEVLAPGMLEDEFDYTQNLEDANRENQYLKPTLLENMIGAAPGIANIAMGLGKDDKLELDRIKPISAKYIDLDESRKSADRLYAAQQDATRNVAGNTGGGNYLSNMQASYLNYLQGLSGIDQQEQNTNAQIGNQTAAQNAQIAAQNSQMDFREQDYDARTKAAKQAMIATGIGQIADTYQGNQQNKFLTNTYLPTISPDYAQFYKWEKDPNKNWLGLNKKNKG